MAGYELVADWISRDFRSAVLEKFGPPKTVTDHENRRRDTFGQRSTLEAMIESGASVLGYKWEAEWQWPSGASASLVEAEPRGLPPVISEPGRQPPPTFRPAAQETRLTVNSKAYADRARERQEKMKKRF